MFPLDFIATVKELRPTS